MDNMDAQTLATVVGSAASGGVITGSGIAMGLRYWLRSTLSRITASEEASESCRVDRGSITTRVAGTEYEVRALRACHEETRVLITALHKRIDDHAAQESADRQLVARELGGLAATIRGLVK